MEIKARRIRTVCGMWKFKKDKVSTDELVRVAYQWKVQGGERYTHLIIRDCSKDQHGIQFSYPLIPGENFEDFYSRITDELKRKFGNDFVGWDVTSSALVIV